MAAELNAYITFTLKRRLKLSSKPHEAIHAFRIAVSPISTSAEARDTL